MAQHSVISHRSTSTSTRTLNLTHQNRISTRRLEVVTMTSNAQDAESKQDKRDPDFYFTSLFIRVSIISVLRSLAASHLQRAGPECDVSNPEGDLEMAIKDILSTAFHPRDGRVGDVSRILEGMPDCSGRGQSRGLQSPSLLSLSKVSPLQFKYELFS